MSVKYLKFKNGDDVVAKVKSQDEKTIVLENILRLVFTGQGIATLPYLLVAKNKQHAFPMSEVFVMDDPEDNMTEEYNRNFSEIIIPSASSTPNTIKLK